MCSAFPWAGVLWALGAFAFAVLFLMYLDGYWTADAAIKRAQVRAYNRLLNGTPRASDIDAARHIIRNSERGR